MTTVRSTSCTGSLRFTFLFDGTEGDPNRMTTSTNLGSTLDVPWWAWLTFAIVVVVSLAVDLFVHRGDRAVGRREGLLWSAAWVIVSLLFAGWVGLQFGAPSALEFLTAYLVEKSLSVDNLFVFLVIFGRLRIPTTEQHRVLFWGILGAFVTRAIFVVAGTALLARWHVAVYVLGAFLVFTGVKTLRTHSDDDAKKGWILPFLQRHMPFSPRLHGHHFSVVEGGKRLATPLFLALLAIEVTDVLFAVDSIAAVLAISNSQFIVFSSNVFAILGLRALYLVLAELVSDLRYLHYGLGGILVFVGAKMLGSRFVHLPHWVSLLITVAILLAAIVPSLVSRRRRRLLEVTS
jgi:tellurite resistance protein TerC